MSHFALENRAHTYLAEKREEERAKRPSIISDVLQLRRTDRLPGGFTDEFVDELRSTPFDWRIDIFEEGIRFLRDFPYETVFYIFRGWDAARVVINLDVQKAAVAFRIHLFDGQADMTIDEGVLIEDGQLVAFDSQMIGYGIYLPYLRQVTREMDTTRGESGCTFDHLKPELDRLPKLLQQLCGDAYCRFAATFYRLVDEGKIDPETMPKLSLIWPLLSSYHAAKG